MGTKNKIISLFQSITNEELLLAIKQIKEDSDKGTFSRDGYVRKYCRIINEMTDGSLPHDVTFVKNELLKEAAYRWLSANQ